MMDTRELTKLVELRAKTDRQLVEYINNRLDAGITFARLVTDPETRTRWASTDLFEGRARQALQEARQLLPCVSNLGSGARRPLLMKLKQLREMLEEISSGGPCLRAACF